MDRRYHERKCPDVIPNRVRNLWQAEVVTEIHLVMVVEMTVLF